MDYLKLQPEKSRLYFAKFDYPQPFWATNPQKLVTVTGLADYRKSEKKIKASCFLPAFFKLENPHLYSA